MVEEKSKPTAKAYSKSRFRGGSWLKYIFFVLALCFVGLLVALSSSNQPLGKVHMPHLPVGRACRDPFTGMAVKCRSKITEQPYDERWEEEIGTEEFLKGEEQQVEEEKRREEEGRGEEQQMEEKKRREEEGRGEEQQMEEKKRREEEGRGEEQQMEEKKRREEEGRGEEQQMEEKKRRKEEGREEERKKEEQQREEEKRREEEGREEERKRGEQQREEEKNKEATAIPQDDGLTALERENKPNKRMVERIAQDGYLVVTWANWHYQDFVHTWVTHVKDCGVTGYIVGAMDDRLMQTLIDKGYNTFSMRSGLTESDFGWGTPTFAKMGREKIKLIRVFLELDVTVIISDVDVLWLRNPIPYFQGFPTADILSSSDHLTNTVDDYQLEKWPQAASAANIGIMMFRRPSLELVNEWIDVIEKDSQVWDQHAFNDLFRRGLIMVPDEPQHLFLGYQGKLKMGILPVAAFGSGHTFFTQRMHLAVNLQPYALHATFQFAGTPGKRHRMREFMLFEDPPSYYDHPVGFITYSVDNLEPLLQDAGPNTGSMHLDNVQGHFKLVNHQLNRLRNAFAISTVLGRATVIPQFYCGLDRWWAPHTGRIPGSHFHLPFPCPLDHVMELDSGMTRGMDPVQFGKPTEFREFSFFANSRTPESVRSNKVVVEICPAGQPDCNDGLAPAVLQGGRVRVQAALSSERLRTALSSVHGYKVLEFTTMANAFGGFTDPADWDRFTNRIKGYTSLWCCVAAHPGHVHYDMLWDVPNHVDKFGRRWGQWEPQCGP